MKSPEGLASVPAAIYRHGTYNAPYDRLFETVVHGPVAHLKGILLTLNFELFGPVQRLVPSNLQSAPG
jgi:hypothetical protein